MNDDVICLRPGRTLFGLTIVSAIGIKAPLNYSVFSAAGGAMLLGVISRQTPRPTDKSLRRLLGFRLDRHRRPDRFH